MQLYPKLILVAFLTGLAPMPGLAQEPPEGNMRKSLREYAEKYFQQKTYLHIDKSTYRPGEHIWFQGYVTDMQSRRPDQTSTNLYVEMLNFRGQVVRTKLLKLQNGTAANDFYIQDTVPQGSYQIRAYTHWMKNLPPGFWFSTQIKIKNKKQILYEYKDKRKANRLLRKIDKYDVRFFAEGGNYVQGLPASLGIKAVDPLNHGVAYTGRIIDGQGQTQARFESSGKGMAAVRFIPKNDDYQAVLKFTNGTEKQYDLPDLAATGIVLHVGQASPGAGFEVKIHTNRPTPQTWAGKFVSLTAMADNRVHFEKTFQLADSATLTIPAGRFPPGLVQFTLFNADFMPVCERLRFHYPAAPVQLVAKGKDGQSATFLLQGAQPAHQFGQSTFSAAIIKPEARPQQNILASMLLSSDLKGHIETPAWYFPPGSAPRYRPLDHLLLTQGWRRFRWQEVLSNAHPPPAYHVEQGLEITGKVTRPLIKIPLEGAPVDLVILNEYNETFKTRTNEDGNYAFRNLHYKDTVDVMVKARRKNGKETVLVYVDKSNSPKEDYEIRRPQAIVEAYAIRRKQEKEAGTQNTAGSRGVLHNNPDQVIYFDDVSTSGYSNIMQVLQGRVPGMNAVGGQTVLRGINSINLSSEPLYLVDNVPTDKGAVMSIPVQDVERVEILKNASNTAIYGVNGANGVIAVYTKEGHHVIHGRNEFRMLGYASEREYYRPKFANKTPTGQNLTTIHWQPHITPSANGKLTVNLPAQAPKGEYIIRLEGYLSGYGPLMLEKTITY